MSPGRRRAAVSGCGGSRRVAAGNGSADIPRRFMPEQPGQSVLIQAGQLRRSRRSEPCRPPLPRACVVWNLSLHWLLFTKMTA